MLQLTAFVLAFATPAWVLLFLPYLLPYVPHLVALIIAAVFVAVVHLVLRFTKPGRVRHYSLAILDAGKVGALLIEQTTAAKLRGPDGKLSPDAAASAKGAAVEAALDWLRLHGLEQVKASLQLTDEQLEARLGVAVEVAVAQMPSGAELAAKAIEPLKKLEPMATLP